ncbi:restriction endonuclease subunit S [Pseudomonas sp. JV449]|uniref:restriction endonuclease subunit S n=1 Tax=Pseudomonas sp. JV449 TaxID=1890658 RepID=UPI0028E12153|nr:restriction endonuclease subunit S [Pseudomonas sp. JV449]MDT9634908.1 restriction endonuclease subunit S [Pseudomonas sp. JV449]
MSMPKLRFPEFSHEWEEKLLGDFFSFKNGVNADKSMYGFGHKFINVLDVIADHPIYWDTILGSVSITDKEFEKNEVVFGDILFQRSSEIREEAGQSNVYLDAERKATFGGFVIRGRPITELNSIYFNALLKTSKARKDISDRSGGSTRFNVGQKTLASVPVDVTPLIVEQEKIASFLDVVDARRRSTVREKELLVQYKVGLMQQLFTRQVRFCDENGMAFPDWVESPLKEVFSERSERGNANEALLSITMQRGIVRAEDLQRSTSASADRSNYKTVYPGDIAYNSMRMWQGASGVANEIGIVSPAYTVITPLEGQVADFWGHYFKLDRAIKLFQSYSQGLTSDTWNLKFPALSSIAFTYPCVAEQRRIADVLNLFDDKIAAVESQLKKINLFKKGLLQQLFV